MKRLFEYEARIPQYSQRLFDRIIRKDNFTDTKGVFSSDFISNIVRDTMVEGVGKGEEEDFTLAIKGVDRNQRIPIFAQKLHATLYPMLEKANILPRVLKFVSVEAIERGLNLGIEAIKGQDNYSEFDAPPEDAPKKPEHNEPTVALGKEGHETFRVKLSDYRKPHNFKRFRDQGFYVINEALLDYTPPLREMSYFNFVEDYSEFDAPRISEGGKRRNMPQETIDKFVHQLCLIPYPEERQRVVDEIFERIRDKNTEDCLKAQGGG